MTDGEKEAQAKPLASIVREGLQAMLAHAAAFAILGAIGLAGWWAWSAGRARVDVALCERAVGSLAEIAIQTADPSVERCQISGDGHDFCLVSFLRRDGLRATKPVALSCAGLRVGKKGSDAEAAVFLGLMGLQSESPAR
jgi:hypothetical protein